MTSSTSPQYPVGRCPTCRVPSRMFARSSARTFGGARDASRSKRSTLQRGDEGLVGVMAAGINYNNVWAAMGVPIDMIAVRMAGGDPRDFHIGGSDASGIIYAVGSDVTKVKVGDEVVVHPGWWDRNDPAIKAGRDPMASPSSNLWGTTQQRSFGQFAIAPAPSACPRLRTSRGGSGRRHMLVGPPPTDAYGWSGNTLTSDDIVLVWGGSGGPRLQAIKLVKHAGDRSIDCRLQRKPARIARASGRGLHQTARSSTLGPPHWDDSAARGLGRPVRGVGQKIGTSSATRNPTIVFEHPGGTPSHRDVSLQQGGLVVICAGASGYSAMVDLPT